MADYPNDPFNSGKRNRPPRYTVKSTPRGMDDPQMKEAMASKLHKPDAGRTGINIRDQRDLGNYLPMSQMSNLSLAIAHKIRDAKIIMKNLPDIKLAGEIVVMAICNLGTNGRKLSLSSSHEKLVPRDVLEELLRPVERYMEDELALNKEISKIVHNALVEKGSHPILILPESTIDEVINGDKFASGNQSYQDIRKNTLGESWGVFGNGLNQFTMDVVDLVAGNNAGEVKEVKRTVSIDQSFLNYSITDNLDALKLPELKKKQVRKDLSEIYASRLNVFNGIRGSNLAAGNNNSSGSTDLNSALKMGVRHDNGRVSMMRDYGAMMEQDKKFSMEQLAVLKHPTTLKKKSVGNAVVRYLPPESLIPIIDPTKPDDPVAYIMITDAQTGSPICLANMIGSSTNMQQTDMSQSLVVQTNAAMSMENQNPNMGGDAKPSMIDRNMSRMIYINLVWENLKEQVKNGVLGDSYVVTKPEDVFSIMYDMALQKKEARAVFIPADLMVYWAYNYMEDGTGESLIESSKPVSSQRMVQTYCRSYHSWMSSINRRRLDITIDPRDPDRYGAAKQIYWSFLENNSHMIMPNNVVDPTSLSMSIFNQAFEVNLLSDPTMPSSKIEVQPIDYQKVEPDEALSEDLRKQTAMHFSLTPDQIDMTLGDDNVTTKVLNNQMFRERISGWQEITNFHATKLVRTCTLHSSYLLDSIYAIAKKHQNKISKNGIGEEEGQSMAFDIDRFVYNFIGGLKVSVPKLDQDIPEADMSKFQEYKTNVETVVDEILFSSDLFQANSENAQLENMELIKAAIKADLLWDYLEDRNMLVGLERYKSLDDEESAALADQIFSRVSTIFPAALKLAQKLRGVNDASKDTLPPRGGQLAGDGGGDDSGGDEFGGGDDFGGGEDDPLAGLDDGTTEEQPEEDTPPEETPDEGSDETL